MTTFITNISFKTDDIKVTHTYGKEYFTIDNLKGAFVQPIHVESTAKAQEYVHNLAKMYRADIEVQIVKVDEQPYNQTVSHFKLIK